MTSERKLISTGSHFEKTIGYSRAVVDGEWCFASGTTGYDYTTMKMPDSIEEQTHNCLKTIQNTLKEAGFDLKDVVRCRYCVNSRDYVKSVYPILGSYFGEIRPAATMIICELVEPEMKIEIDVTAKKRK